MRWWGPVGLFAALAFGCETNTASPDASLERLADGGALDASLDDAGETGDAGSGSDGGTAADGGCLDLDSTGCPLKQPSGSSQTGCDSGCNAATASYLTCEYAASRCRCSVGPGYYWACESSACPKTGAAAGATCNQPGLFCGARFEDPGFLCESSTMSWLRCEYARAGTGGQLLHCPPWPPAVGSTCCIIPLGIQAECTFSTGDGGPPDRYGCVSYQWKLLP